MKLEKRTRMIGDMGIEEAWSKAVHVGHESGKKSMAGWKGTRKWALQGMKERNEN